MSSKPPYYHHPKTQHHQGFDPLLFRQVKRFSSSHLPNTSSSPDDWVVGITPNHPIGKTDAYSRPKAARPLADPIPKHALRREYAWGGVVGLRWDRHSQG
jgi:hypothetical protein